ncbi:MAG: PKD domain-containing protein [Phycisphaerae bacterium]
MLLAVSAASAADRWWNPQFAYRRVLRLPANIRQTGHDGPEIGVFTMATCGLTQPDGSDIRVVTAGGAPVPARVLMMGPGDLAKVAFGIEPGQSTYYVYFGTRNPPKPPRKLQIRRGLLLETWANPGGKVNTLKQARAVFDKADKLLGRDFRSRVFLGHNPFGPGNQIANRFVGYFSVDRPGEYLFAITSRDASFLLVDDELLISNGGLHGPVRRSKARKKITLDKGLHKVEMLHVNFRADPVAVLAWQPPGAKRTWPMKPRDFLSVYPARQGPLQRYGRKVEVDLSVDHAGEAFFANRYAQRYRFGAGLFGYRGARWVWDFGDGQISSAPNPQHVYLADGTYTVRLVATTGVGTFQRQQKIVVTRPWDKVHINKLDSLKQQAQIVSGYDFAKLSVEANHAAVLLLDRAGFARPALVAARTLLKRGGELKPEALGDVALAMAESLVQTDKPAEAADALQNAAKRTDSPKVRAELYTRAGQILLEMGKPEPAEKLFRNVLMNFAAATNTPAIRDARIGMGNCRRAAGDADKAAEAYKSAGLGKGITLKKLPITRGDYARHVEAYTADGKLNDAGSYLDKWASDIPADQLEGYWSLLKARLCVARKDLPAAVREAEILLKVNPTSNYAPQLLLLTADAHAAQNQARQARAALRKLVQEYPESELAEKAAERLSKQAAGKQ